ncbi:acetyltransferase family protein [[Clostridium] bifermentans ATCC 19299]|uniref:GNAT family N-acetyltransferase n=1 Tax=Paraclostridium bifermentans TaxID=1490 RepID=UPI00038D0712|nr:GNAT family N-acetyltransferase [Paraclostridium bifermentans]EQK39578.1 acetyltransferase family protein [[Clostridium] bifermentans ATCC 19299] [Paraclostridium bifermentans ATCC 19299]
MLLTFKIHIQYGFLLIGSIQFIENYKKNKYHYVKKRKEKRENFIGYADSKNNLVGFVNLLDEGESVFFGIGIKPEYCGIGIGKQIVSMALDECKRRYPSKPIILEVRSWNKRALRCYESQGFKVIDRKHQETYLGTGEFFIMEYIKK